MEKPALLGGSLGRGLILRPPEYMWYGAFPFPAYMYPAA